ncbi:MAG: type II toxin-antitoxin system prevent-host-death family antitoxin [Deltaproteobacteria bacterium]|nr:type II toxin-antitoxin system prevent-host-death family antitoxin [Deltaproteobacteria bacterium]
MNQALSTGSDQSPTSIQHWKRRPPVEKDAHYLTRLVKFNYMIIMKSNEYSTYDAKAKFSELLRKVKKNKKIVITSRGIPIAELVPFSNENENTLERLSRLEQQGVIDGDTRVRDPFEPIEKSSGALKRFLNCRGES